MNLLGQEIIKGIKEAICLKIQARIASRNYLAKPKTFKEELRKKQTREDRIEK